MNDSQGKEVEAGSYFVYAVRDGNGASMRCGLVINVSGSKVKTFLAMHSWTPNGREWRLTSRTQTFTGYNNVCESMVVVQRETLNPVAASLLDVAAADSVEKES